MLAQGPPSPRVQARYLRTTTTAINTHRETHPRPHRAVSTAAPHQHHSAPPLAPPLCQCIYVPSPSPLHPLSSHQRPSSSPPRPGLSVPNPRALCLRCHPLPSRHNSLLRFSDVSPGTLPSAGARAAIPSGPSLLSTHHHRSHTGRLTYTSTHTQSRQYRCPSPTPPCTTPRPATMAMHLCTIPIITAPPLLSPTSLLIPTKPWPLRSPTPAPYASHAALSLAAQTHMRGAAT